MSGAKANSRKGRRKTRKGKQGGLSVVPVLTKGFTHLRHVIPKYIVARNVQRVKEPLPANIVTFPGRPTTFLSLAI